MSDIREVKITTKDIESVSEKLHAFAKQLPAGEQNVMAWLLGRAAQAPQESAGLKGGLAAHVAGDVPAKTVATAGAHVLTPTDQLTRALGVSQFTKLRPGSAVAGSSIGVTGTVMF